MSDRGEHHSVKRLVVVMPAWNEAKGLPGFINELSDELRDWLPMFWIVDDFSSDGTSEVLQSLSQSGLRVQWFTNMSNLGHGPSTVTALNLGVRSGAEFVLAVDGDGQFIGQDIRRVIEILESTMVDVVEGVRTSRNDPAYRRFVSLCTRLLVASRVHMFPADANTPLRAYRASTLARILGVLPADSATPNLIISALSRRWSDVMIHEEPVRSISRRGGTTQSVTWGKSLKRLPSKRFVFFLFRATLDWATVRIPNRSKCENDD